MGIFHCYVSSPEGNLWDLPREDRKGTGRKRKGWNWLSTLWQLEEILLGGWSLNLEFIQGKWAYTEPLAALSKDHKMLTCWKCTRILHPRRSITDPPWGWNLNPRLLAGLIFGTSCLRLLSSWMLTTCGNACTSFRLQTSSVRPLPV